ncbi:MAG TPA: hypothetical protein VKH63_11785 [Candidatus Acidoferrum sp.]|jgi:hypothetical protein|nr:hypothetical protein [Candidatus Acidoferrum sp.]
MSEPVMSEASIGEKGNARHIGRSVVAVLAGMIVGIILSLGTDLLLHNIHVFPPWGASMAGYEAALLLALIYRTIYGVLGSYIAARLAPDRPMLHAMVLGVLGFAVSTLGAVATWNGGPAFEPHWYPVALVVLALPTAWVGGKIRLAQLGATSAQ